MDEHKALFFDLDRFSTGVTHFLKHRDDTAKYLENYQRIVRLIGNSFPNTGIEILLHNLSNPAKALYHIENNVTGRNIGAPATNLVHASEDAAAAGPG